MKIQLNRVRRLNNVNLNKMSSEQFHEFFENNKWNKKYFSYLGDGTTRRVFMFWFNNHKYIIKELKKHWEIDNGNQNAHELEIYKRALENGCERFLSQVVLSHSDNNYIIMKYSDDVDMMRYTRRNYLTKSQSQAIDNYTFEGEVPFNNIAYACYLTKTNFNDFISDLEKLQSIGMSLEDLYLENLGVQNKKLVVRDFGIIEKGAQEDEA